MPNLSRARQHPQPDDAASAAGCWGAACVKLTVCAAGSAAAPSPPLLSNAGSAVASRRKRSLMLKPSLAEVSMNMISCGMRKKSQSERDVCERESSRVCACKGSSETLKWELLHTHLLRCSRLELGGRDGALGCKVGFVPDEHDYHVIPPLRAHVRDPF